MDGDTQTVTGGDCMSLMYRHPRIYEAVLRFIHKDALHRRYTLVSSMIRGNSVFDIGCGTAMFHPYVKDKHYIGWDLNPRFVRHARKKGANVVSQDILAFDDYPEADTYVIFDVLHHIQGARDLMRHALEKGNRRVIVCEPFDTQGMLAAVALMRRFGMYNTYMKVIGDYDGINMTWNRPWFDRAGLEHFFGQFGTPECHEIGGDLIAVYH